LGFQRVSAAQFSFLMSVPIILLSAGWQLVGLLSTDGAQNTHTMQIESLEEPWFSLCIAIVASALAAYFCIKYFLKVIERIGFMPFILYRLVLGLALMGVMFLG